MIIDDATAAAAAPLYPSMATPGPSPWVNPADPLEKLYSNSPGLIAAPPPPAPLPREAVMYAESPAMFDANLREHEEHWARQAAGIDPAVRTAAAAALAALPAVVRGTLQGAGVDLHPDVIAWLGRRR